jgi:hypothetical protein
MQLANSTRDLLPENDPPVWPSIRFAWWVVILISVGVAATTVLGMIWGGLDVWESLGGIVLGLAAAVLGLMWLSRNAAKGPGTPADDDALRDEIRKWQHGRHHR